MNGAPGSSADSRHLQRAAHEWVLQFPSGYDIWRRLAKLTEEVGELSRAVIGQDEGRANRGDPQQEAAQVCLVLMTIAELLGFDLIEAAYAEFLRAALGRDPRAEHLM